MTDGSGSAHSQSPSHVVRPIFNWNLGTRSLELGKRTLIMGVLNVTPDSFSDGGRFFEPARALEHAERLLAEGADIIDIGGESTRPGVRVEVGVPIQPGQGNEKTSFEPSSPRVPVSAEEELKRVIPVISGVKQKHSDALISIDTYKAAVASEAVKAGAEIVNDVSGLRWDPRMIQTVAELKCGVVLMHMRGRPDEWRNLRPVDDIVSLVRVQLWEWAEHAVAAGVRRDKIALDPGFGFGKNFEQNYPLISRLNELHELKFPLLVGTSRKSFIGKTVSGGARKTPPLDRLYGTLASEAALVLQGAHIVRTHDVRASLEAARIADAILTAS